MLNIKQISFNGPSASIAYINKGTRQATEEGEVSITHHPLHILIVEDEEDVRTTLKLGFEAEGFTVTEASNSSELYSALGNQQIDLITLDLGLEGDKVDGLNLATEIRSKFNLPIIIITGRNEPIDRVAGLEKGADDYITKPFLIREAALRVRNVAKRYGLLQENSEETIDDNRKFFGFSNYVLDPIKRELRTLEGNYISLTETEFNLLEMFLKKSQRVLTRDEMMQKLRGHEWAPLDRGIDGHIARLRRKIEPHNEEAPSIIKSVRGVGYVFVREVSRMDPFGLPNASEIAHANSSRE